MPRPPRVHVKGVLYYVTQQGAHDQPLFRKEADAVHYLELLRQYKIKHRFNLYGYSLLSEKIALLMEPLSETTISEIMRDLTSRYSKYYNSEYCGSGPLFKGRFRASMAEKEESLGTLVRFLHTQPVFAGASDVPSIWASSRDLFLSEPAGSVLEMKNAMRPEVMELESTLHEQGLSLSVVTEAMPAADYETLELQLAKPVMGSAAFTRRLQESIQESAASRIEVPAEVPAAAVSVPVLKTAALRSFFTAALVLSLASAGGFYAWQAGFFPVKEPAVETKPLTVSAAPAVPAAPVPAAPAGKSPEVVLNGSSWDIHIIPKEKSEKTNVTNDILLFSDNKVISRSLEDNGFTPTHYNMTVNPDGKITWETMQRSESGEIIFWRGEWRGDEMRGVLNRQYPSGESKVFHFLGKSRAG